MGCNPPEPPDVIHFSILTGIIKETTIAKVDGGKLILLLTTAFFTKYEDQNKQMWHEF